MKIVGIEPKSPGLHVFSKWAIPRLGLPILGAILSQAGNEVKIFVEEIAKIDWSEVSSADLVMISTITSTAPRAFEFAQGIKAKGIPVILGGPHPSALPGESLEFADFVVRGEGEKIILPLIKAIENGRGFEDIKGLSYKLFGQIFHNPAQESWCNLDDYPAPNFSLIQGWSGKNVVPIQTSRGCPYDCKFCCVQKIFGRQVRHKSAEKVIEELKNQKAKHIFFVDDNFAANPEKTKELLRKIINENLKIEWSTQVRIGSAKDTELISLMKRAGCFVIQIGIESINPESLEDVRKKQTVNEIVEGIKVFHRYGIKIHGMFVVGFDADNIKTVRETAKFAIKKVDSAQIMILTPLPGTETYGVLQKENRLLPIDWDKYDAHHIVFLSKIAPHLLQIETVKAMARFYSWRQVVKNLFLMKWWNGWAKFYGHRLTNRWKKEIKEYLKFLRVICQWHTNS